MDDDTNYVIVAEDQLSSRDLDFQLRKPSDLILMSLQTRKSQSCEKCLTDMETNFIAEASVTDEKGLVFNFKGKSCGKAGHFVTHNLPYRYLKVTSAVVRAFAKKEDVDFNKHWAKDVTFLVKSVPIFGDRNYLSEISPVFDRMFNGKFAEANQQEIELGDVKPNSFNDFLMAIWRKPVMPNSANVVELLELADRFDVASLRDNCEKHLRISSEMELVDQLILSQNYHLKSLQDFLVNQITAEVWLQLQRSKNWMEKIGALNGITVSRITTKLALELDKIHEETERRNIRKAEKKADKKRGRYVMLIWHFDHELAAIQACRIAFPTDRVVSCYFHFVKNCISNAHDLGLKKRLAKDVVLRKWLRTLLGGVFLTNDHQSVMWDYLLQNPPQIPERANLTRFVNYFRRQWHTDAARALINQHENHGPRTTNFSEGWNNTAK
ncbi:BTB/POZ domain-containing protein [Ditylenchus destructor]|nr:BTB/POZ domain-containing protein [Ditylenchus destructor]